MAGLSIFQSLMEEENFSQPYFLARLAERAALALEANQASDKQSVELTINIAVKAYEICGQE